MNTGTIVLFAVFGGIVLIMIAIAITGTRKDKNKRALETYSKEEKLSNANSQINKLWEDLYKIVNWTKKKSDSVRSGKDNSTTLSEIDIKSKKDIEKIRSGDMLKQIYELDNYKAFLKPIILNLSKAKPSTWEKKQFFEHNIIIAKKKSIDLKKKNENKDISDEK